MNKFLGQMTRPMWIAVGVGAVLGLILGLAMIISIFAGTMAGVLIPLALKKMNQDPALGSNILLTAFTDAFGFFSYLTLATIFLKLLL